MRAVRSLAALGVAAAATVLPSVPALAHGAPTTPLSRTAACAPNGEEPDLAVCKAATRTNGGAIGSFDNLRIANVNGRDKAVVPDGHLCSGGLDRYRGLDLARDDWPTTEVTAGKTLNVKYAGTIPHRGEFRLYLTKPGYDPQKALAWADLSGSPLATVTDPPLRDGSYRMSVTIPRDRSGPQLLYVVWETSSTPDTYYSCSDLRVKAKAAPAVATTAPTRSKSPSPSPSRSVKASKAASPAAQLARRTTPPATEAPELTPVASQVDDSRAQLGHWIIGGALAVIVAAGGTALVSRRRTAR
ncbi:lytic polysaccharide monooxygenase [Actinoplanes sp. NPDC051494]|uniref:lytic polysaccharide monooxygenase n=1 Tax=Actinoplanes sp. NPDC051494 TaxID=3363907 RepID=UPI0037B465B7